MLPPCGQDHQEVCGHMSVWATWPDVPPASMATVDQVGQALQALRAAEDGVPQAEQRARQLIADARAAVADARANLAEAIVEAYDQGARVSELASRAQYSRETIRRILRAAGFEAGG